MTNELGVKIIISIMTSIVLLLVVLNVFAIVVPQEWILYTNGSNIQEILSADLKEADIVVIDYSTDGTDKFAFKKEDIQILKNAGKKVFCYLNFSIAEEWRFYWRYLDKSIVLGPLENWSGEYYVKFWYTEWYKVISEYMKKIIYANFDGVVLDWTNVYENVCLQKLTGKSSEVLKSAIVENIRKMMKDFPNVDYVLINGEDILLEFPGLREKVKYVLVESLFFKNTKLVTNTKLYLQRLNKLL